MLEFINSKAMRNLGAGVAGVFIGGGVFGILTGNLMGFFLLFVGAFMSKGILNDSDDL